jgi:hypothetical protein
VTAVTVAVGLAVLAAAMFAVAATLQNSAFTAPAVGGRSTSVLIRADGLRALMRAPTWLAGGLLAAIGSVTHAGALALAPVAIVQPIGALAVPFAIVIDAVRSHARPPASLVINVAACLVSVAGFVTLADAQVVSPIRPGSSAVLAVLTAAVLTAALSIFGSRRSRWLRCVAFAASGATAFGLVSALMRLIWLNITDGVQHLGVVSVVVPASGVVLALLVGGWAVQQAHAAGSPAVVVGCLTVIDPLVAVVLGIAVLGEEVASSPGSIAGLTACAGVGLGSVLVLARHHPTPARPQHRHGRCVPRAAAATHRSSTSPAA